jgi:hypothetical protein
VAVLLAAAGTALALLSIVIAHVILRVWRSNPAVYDRNRVITGSFRRAATGRIDPLIHGTTDFQVNHFAEPVVNGSGEIIWERSGSLSDEAVDGVLTRQR